MIKFGWFSAQISFSTESLCFHFREGKKGLNEWEGEERK